MITLDSKNRVYTTTRIPRGSSLGVLKGYILCKSETIMMKEKIRRTLIPFIHENLNLCFLPRLDMSQETSINYVKRGRKPNMDIRVETIEEEILGELIRLPVLHAYALRNIRINEDIRRLY